MDGLCYSTIWGDCDCLRLGENKKLKVTNKVGIYTVSSGTFTSRVHVCLLDTLSPRFLVKASYLLMSVVVLLSGFIRLPTFNDCSWSDDLCFLGNRIIRGERVVSWPLSSELAIYYFRRALY